MGWIVILALALGVAGLLWRFARFDRAALQLLAAILLFALAGYAWQGRPALQGAPKASAVREEVADSDFAAMRQDLLGRFDSAGVWLTIAESYQRRGNTRAAVDIIRNGLRRTPSDAVLWVGLGNALVIHGDGLVSPAAQLAFSRAAEIAPDHPGPPFFYGLALAQSGEIGEAERIWRELLGSAPEGSPWRKTVEGRLQVIDQARAAGQIR
jgi:cytochrome c-type biogenesis protein CcmH